MLKLGTQTGSLINHLMSTDKQQNINPEIGMGCTVLSWSDRYAATIIAKTNKTITIQYDTATRIDKNGLSDSQSYKYSPNPNGKIIKARMTKQGWKSKDYRVMIGNKDHFIDPSF